VAFFIIISSPNHTDKTKAEKCDTTLVLHTIYKREKNARVYPFDGVEVYIHAAGSLSPFVLVYKAITKNIIYYFFERKILLDDK